MTTTVQAPERAAAATSTWNIDPTHSTAEFAVKHMMVSTVKGRFKSLTGGVIVNEADPTRSVIEAAIDVTSVDTGAEQRDEHLRSDDFFNAERYPQMTFRSTRIVGKDDDWKVAGDLTIREVTKPVASTSSSKAAPRTHTVASGPGSSLQRRFVAASSASAGTGSSRRAASPSATL